MRKLIDSHGGLLRLLTSLPAWTGATWALDGNGRAYNTPTLGSELLTNGNMELDANWSNYLTPTVNERSTTQVHGGTYARRFVTDANGEGIVSSAIAMTSGNWYRIDGWLHATTGAVFAVRNDGAIADFTSSVSPAGSWANINIVTRCLASGNNAIRLQSGIVGTNEHFADDFSVKAITAATNIATIIGIAGQTVTAKPYAITTGTQAGVISHLDEAASPANFIIAYHNGISAIMDKCVGGTYTNLVTATVSFVSDAAIEIRPLGSNQFDCYYNGSKQGNTATVSDAGIISNTRYGLFSTYSGNTFSEFTLGGAVVALALPGA